MAKLNFAALVLDSKTVEFEFPAMAGFKVQITYTTAEKYASLRKECVTTKLDPHSGYPVESIDQEKWNSAFCKQTISGWKGLTYDHLASMILLDESAIEDMTEEVEYSEEGAEMLLKHSKAFDAWVRERMSDLNNFR